MVLFTLLCMLSISVGLLHGLPSGPPLEFNGSPTQICSTLRPTASSPHMLQSGNGGYYIYTDLPITTISVGPFYNFTDGETYFGLYVSNISILFFLPNENTVLV